MEPTAHEASEQAVHKAKSAAAAIELAREAQQQELIEKTASKTKEALLEGLREVFGDGDAADTQQMKVLVARVPILCTSIESMHKSIESIEANQTWAVRLIIGAVLLALLKLVLIP